jgi:hypothetical protein
VLDDIDQEEDEDASGEGAQARLEGGARIGHPPEREPEEDGRAGDSAE